MVTRNKCERFTSCQSHLTWIFDYYYTRQYIKVWTTGGPTTMLPLDKLLKTMVVARFGSFHFSLAWSRYYCCRCYYIGTGDGMVRWTLLAKLPLRVDGWQSKLSYTVVEMVCNGESLNSCAAISSALGRKKIMVQTRHSFRIKNDIESENYIRIILKRHHHNL